MITVELPGGRALFTDRRGGVSTPPYDSLNLGCTTGDDPDAVAANRRRLEAAVGRPVVTGRQVHGMRVARIRRTDADRPSASEAVPAEADGQATDRCDVAVGVLVADCLPIALAGEGAVAMVHAGWRGLAEGVVEEGVRAVRELGASGELHAVIGPGAGGCCYEVGDEVRAALGCEGPTADLKAIARRRLEDSGVARVRDLGLCTLCAEPGRFFSHRRDGGATGRQIGVAWRVGSPD